MRYGLGHLIIAAAVACVAPCFARAETVDVELVLAADVSLSVEDVEFLLQRHGYAAALQSADVLKAIRAGQHGAIAVCFVEFAGESQQKVVVDWTIIRDEGSAAIFSASLLTAPRSFTGYASLSGAIDFAAKHFGAGGLAADRRIINISADGTNAAGRPVTAARDDAVAGGISVNGLAIANVAPKRKHIEHTQPPEGLNAYFRRNVIGGPGAFVADLDDSGSSEAVIADALRREILAAEAQAGHTKIER